MHTVKGQNQQLFTKLASGNEMAASVKEISFFFFFLFFPESKHKCVKKMNQLISLKQSFMAF